jgi:two-component system phosphate regulon response regulator PhoB
MSGKKVVVVEDDLTMVNLLKTLLKMEGFEVVALDADSDVVKAVSSNCPDVLLLDVHLVHQNGLDILDSMRRSDQPCKARIVMISGLNLREECMKRGADGFLLKPFMPDDLIRMLKGQA